jgi:hypothetical protein
LQYNRARYYDPATGRWISQDPLGFDAGDSNLYRYAQNRPPSATDPSGDYVFATGLTQAQEAGDRIKAVYKTAQVQLIPLPTAIWYIRVSLTDRSKITAKADQVLLSPSENILLRNGISAGYSPNKAELDIISGTKDMSSAILFGLPLLNLFRNPKAPSWGITGGSQTNGSKRWTTTPLTMLSLGGGAWLRYSLDATAFRRSPQTGMPEGQAGSVWLEYSGPNAKSVRWVQFFKVDYQFAIREGKNVTLGPPQGDIKFPNTAPLYLKVLTTSGSTTAHYFLDKRTTSDIYYFSPPGPPINGNITNSGSAMYDRPTASRGFLNTLFGSRQPDEKSQIGSLVTVTFDDYAVLLRTHKILAHVRWVSYAGKMEPTINTDGLNLSQLPNMDGLSHLAWAREGDYFSVVPSVLAEQNKVVTGVFRSTPLVQ